MENGHRDKGYAWVILCAAFLVLMITDGLHYTFGLLYVELLDTFSEGKAATVLPLSLRMGTTLFAGPIAGGLVNRFGSRAVSVGGAVISAVGYGVSFFAANLSHLYFTYGVVGGFGFGLLNLSANVMVVQYFEKRRALALGVMSSGSSAGSFILNPLTRWLIDTYEWRGTLLIQSALILNCAVCGLLFIPFDPLNRRKKVCFQEYADPVTETLLNVPELCSTASKADSKDSIYMHQEQSTTTISKKSITTYERRHSYVSDDSPAIDPPVRCWNSRLTEIKLYCMRWNASFLEYFNFKVLKNSKCLLFLLCRFWLSLGYEMPFAYLPDLALDLGFSKIKAVWTVTLTAIGSTIGRIFLGWISDKSCIRVLALYISCMVVCGLSSAFLPLMLLFEALISSSFVFGFFSGGCVSLSPVLMTSLFGVEFVSELYGLALFAGLFPLFIGPPLTGWLYDVTGSFTSAFIVSGAEFWIGAIMLLVVPILNNVRRESKQKAEQTAMELSIIPKDGYEISHEKDNCI